MTKEREMISPDKFYNGGTGTPEAQGSVLAARAMHEVQGQIVMAKKFPRDFFLAEKRILDACKRPTLARLSQYAYPRGGKTVTGPSIRLAEVMAQNWGNLDFGIVELNQENGESLVQAYCWDLETNVRQIKVFTVKHERKANNKIEKLSDPRDIYELVANNGARRLRACILGIIPQDITENAIKICNQTNDGDSELPMIDKIRAMVKAFDKLSVSKEMIEEKISHAVEDIDNDKLSELRNIFNSLKDGITKRSDWFKVEKEKSTMANEINESLKKSSDVSLSSKNEIEPIQVLDKVKEPKPSTNQAINTFSLG